MSKRTFKISAVIMAVVLAVLVWLNIWVERETPGDVSFPMVNRDIVWMGAGYNGINAH